MCGWMLPPLALLHSTAGRLQNQSLLHLPPPAAPTGNASCVVGRGVQGVIAALQVSEGAAMRARAKETAFTALTSHASVTACSMRARKDIASSAAAATLEMMGTE